MAYLITLVSVAFSVYSFLIFGYILCSWIPQLKYSPIGTFLQRAVDPYLKPFRQVVPSLGIMDISPVVAYFVLVLAKDGLIFVLEWLGTKL